MPDSPSRLSFLEAAGAWLSSPRLEVGDPAPPFRLPGSDGTTHELAEHLGKRWVALAWFPRAETPG